MRETDLYPPVKALLEGQGYTVKGEVGDCDLVGLRDPDPPVIVELKRSFGLSLVMQGIARQSMTDVVYLAVPNISGKQARRRLSDMMALCRRLGLGLMTVRTGDAPAVEVWLDPGPYRPRKVPSRKARLLREFQRRVGDPTAGGSDKRRPAMTAYRQDALRCAAFLAKTGASKGAVIAAGTGVTNATTLLRRDVYGWFERVERGVYTLTPKGGDALDTYADAVAALAG